MIEYVSIFKVLLWW